MIYKVALFDLDGVILDTESQYSRFWGAIGKEFHPEISDFGNLIKGQTLVQIYDKWFRGQESLQDIITRRLDDFEASMSFPFIPGAHDFILGLRSAKVPTGVVTSSNAPKMKQVYDKVPDFKDLFDVILTSEHFSASKPDPDCYLKAAAHFQVSPTECVVFEDSINGLKAARTAEAYVVGLATTNAPETIKPYSDLVIPDFNAAMPQLF